jgi:hypothetical protein
MSKATKTLSRNINELIDLLMAIEKQKSEKERQRIEDERAGRAEKRAEKRLGIAGEYLDISKAGIAGTKAKEATAAAATETARGSTSKLLRGQYRDLSTQTGKTAQPEQMASRLLGAQSREEVEGIRSDLLVGIEDMKKLWGEQKKTETEKTEYDEWLARLREVSPVAASRMEAIDKGLDVKSAAVAFPTPEEDEDKPSDEWYRNKIISLLTKINPDTQVAYTEEDVIRMLRLSPEQVQTYFGRTEGGVGQVEKGSMATAATAPKSKPVLSAETQSAPVEEDYNPADFIPAGDEMPAAGEEGLSPEEQKERDLIEKAVAQATKLTTEDFKKKLEERGFAPDSIERILSGI